MGRLKNEDRFPGHDVYIIRKNDQRGNVRVITGETVETMRSLCESCEVRIRKCDPQDKKGQINKVDDGLSSGPVYIEGIFQERTSRP